MGTSHEFIVDIDGTARTSDRLVASVAVELNAATLTLRLRGARPATGQRFTIVTNATGTFADLPEGGVVRANAVGFRITYRGGTRSRDVVLIAV
jgi:hypothetical protein